MKNINDKEEMSFFHKETNEQFWKIINTSQCTDEVYLTTEQDKTLVKLWQDVRENPQSIPTDLYISNTIPIKDIAICFDQKVNTISRARIIIFDEPLDTDQSKGDIIGAIVISEIEHNVNIGSYLSLTEDKNEFLMLNQLAYRGIDLNNMRVDSDVFRQYMSQILETWYSVQIALIHPTVQEVFKHPKKVKEKIPKSERGDDKKKITRYVKKHYIEENEIEEKLFAKDEHGNFIRKALIWHVIGHYRHYKSGKVGWVKPYWKGALKDTKKGLEENVEINEREIIAQKITKEMEDERKNY